MAFDLYVKINEKYILYIRQGDGLENDRLEKLKSFEGQRLYILKNAMLQFNKYVDDLLEATFDTSFKGEADAGGDLRFFDKQDEQAIKTTIKADQKKTKKSPNHQATNTNVKLSAQMRSLLAQSQEETPDERLKRQARVLESVAQTAIDVLNKIIQDPESAQAYQTATKASKGIIHALNTSPQMIHKLYTPHNGELPPLITHSKNVACLATSMALKSQLPAQELHDLCTAALMHDIGLLKLEDWEERFLENSQERDREQQKTYDQHSQIGFALSDDKSFIPEAVKTLIRDHEENLSGTGPHKLTQLSISSQILALVNRFDKIVLEQGLIPKEAIQYLTLNEIGNYDLKLIELLKKTLTIEKVPEGWAP